MKENDDFYPGTRVMVFDPSLYIDDITTPIKTTVKPATIVCWFGCWNYNHTYYHDSLIDVIFDHRPDKISKSHFTSFVKVI